MQKPTHFIYSSKKPGSTVSIIISSVSITDCKALKKKVDIFFKDIGYIENTTYSSAGYLEKQIDNLRIPSGNFTSCDGATYTLRNEVSPIELAALINGTDMPYAKIKN